MGGRGVEPGDVLLVERTREGDAYVGCYGAHVRVEPARNGKGRPAILVGISADHDAGAAPWIVAKVERRPHSARQPGDGLSGERGYVLVTLVQADHRHEAPEYAEPGGATPVYVGLSEDCPYCLVARLRAARDAATGRAAAGQPAGPEARG